MSSTIHARCGCFPQNRVWPGIAHLMQVTIRGVDPQFANETPLSDLVIAMVDTETTGTDPSKDRIIEIGIVVTRGGEILRRHQTLVQPGMPIPADATKVHGITCADVAKAPTFAKIAAKVAEALKGTCLAAYNAPFDKAFLLAEFSRAGVAAIKPEVEWLDPLVWAREFYAEERSRKLSEMATLLGIDPGKAHRASDDAETAAKVLTALAKDARFPRTYGAIVAEQRRLSMQQSDERRRRGMRW